MRTVVQFVAATLSAFEIVLDVKDGNPKLTPSNTVFHEETIRLAQTRDQF